MQDQGGKGLSPADTSGSGGGGAGPRAVYGMGQEFACIYNSNEDVRESVFGWKKTAECEADVKKKIAALIVVDLVLGMLLLFAYGYTRTEKGKGESQAVSGNSVQTEGLKKIAITFDDGPHSVYTEELLDGLKERGVHATFFVTGEHAELHPEVIKRMSDEGHLIGNHTYSHIQLKDSNREEFRQELIKTNEIISGITGKEVLYVRPPYGTWDKKFETELNMFPVLWTVDPLDWCSTNVGNITNKVVSKVEENDIILMHDYYESTVTAALKVIDELQAEGYTFVTVEELMFD